MRTESKICFDRLCRPLKPKPSRNATCGPPCFAVSTPIQPRSPGRAGFGSTGLLLAGLAVIAVSFPASIPLLLYYL